MRLGNGQLATGRIGKIISDIGEAAGVKVSGKRGQVKYASAPDLRRSFGECWASRIMPQELMELMRHDSIETTVRLLCRPERAKNSRCFVGCPRQVSG